MSLLVVGSVALDSIETPFGMISDALGGSATYFSISASYFVDVRLVAAVGEDFPETYVKTLKEHHIDLAGLHHEKGSTFRWKGYYEYDLNQAHTLETQLNVFEHFKPNIPEAFRNSEFTFLANIDPHLQMLVLNQMNQPMLTAIDTMNFWIKNSREELIDVIHKVNILTLNEAEARQLTDEHNLIAAAKKLLDLGPNRVIIKRGEYGVLMFSESQIFSAPAYPLEATFDPTGAGDTFAGGFMGYLAKTRNFSEESFRKAVIFGCVMASFAVEGFSVDNLKNLSHNDINARFKNIKDITSFGDIS